TWMPRISVASGGGRVGRPGREDADDRRERSARGNTRRTFPCATSARGMAHPVQEKSKNLEGMPRTQLPFAGGSVEVGLKRATGGSEARNESVPRPREWRDFRRGAGLLLGSRDQGLALLDPPGRGKPEVRVSGSQFVAAPQGRQRFLVAPLLPECLAECAVGLCEVRLEADGLARRRGRVGPGPVPGEGDVQLVVPRGLARPEPDGLAERGGRLVSVAVRGQQRVAEVVAELGAVRLEADRLPGDNDDLAPGPLPG